MDSHALTVTLVIAFGLPLSIIDIREHRLPNRIVLIMAVASILLIALSGPRLHALIGAVAAFMFYLALAALPGQGMGMGDVKLSAVLGALTAHQSLQVFAYWLLAPFVLAALASVAMVVTRRARLTTRIPFGPYMFSGAVLALLAIW